MKIAMHFFKRRKMLQQQIELLSERSKVNIQQMDEPYARAMMELDAYLSFLHPIGVAVLGCIALKFAYGFFVALKQLARRIRR